MVSRRPPQNDALEAARAAVRELHDADDWDEPTGRTEVHVHMQQPSQPEIQAPDSDKPSPEKPIVGVLNVALGFKRWPQVAALFIIVSGLLAYLLMRR
jgi:hypothetical protein